MQRSTCTCVDANKATQYGTDCVRTCVRTCVHATSQCLLLASSVPPSLCLRVSQWAAYQSAHQSQPLSDHDKKHPVTVR